MQIFNTLSRQKEIFKPKNPPYVGMYVCGPTVYDFPHLGHARVYVAFDTIVRYLRRHYTVTYVRNFTDVDDKIIHRALERGQTPTQISEFYIEAFSQDMQALGCLPPDVQPKVTEHIEPIIDMIKTLLANGYAYVSGHDVYYAVEKFATYGALGRRGLADMKAGMRVEVDKQKRHPMDFVLWKAAKPQEPSWESPWGAGRPGWHIECSAMSKHYLGASFDLHGGGQDLIFPHHENEIAQSEACNEAPFASFWLHNGLVNIDEEKMSKSLGNFLTIRDVLERYDSQVVRLYLLGTHYRAPIQFADLGLTEAQNRMKYCYQTLQRLFATLPNSVQSHGEIVLQSAAQVYLERFEAAMSDDFNTPQALAVLSDIFKNINEQLKPSLSSALPFENLRQLGYLIQQIGQTLGLFEQDPTAWLAHHEAQMRLQHGVDPQVIEALLAERKDARLQKDFARADSIRVQLEAMGVRIQDAGEHTSWSMIAS